MALIKQEQDTKHLLQSITSQNYASPLLWMRPSAQGRTPDGGHTFNKSQLATSPTFQPSGYTRPFVQNTLHKLEAESSDIQSRDPCGRGDHAPLHPLSDSQPQTSSLALVVQSPPTSSRYRVVRTPPSRRPTLRDVVWFLMNAAKLDAYHQKLVWLYAGNSWVAHLKVLLWVRDFMRKHARLPMLVNIRAAIGAKGGVDSVICQFGGCQMPKPFKEVQSAAEHVVSKHVGGMTWKCKWHGCEKVYNHSFDLKRHEKKHGVATPAKPRTVTKIQRATSARSKAARNAQVVTLSSTGPVLLAPPAQPAGYPHIFPPVSDYTDLSLQCDHTMSSPSAMGFPDSPWSTSFAPSNASSPARINHLPLNPNQDTPIHTEFPASSQESSLTSYPGPMDEQLDQYLAKLTGILPDNTYNSNSDQFTSEIPTPNPYNASAENAVHAQYSALAPAMQIQLPDLTVNGAMKPLDEIWNIPFPWEAPMQSGLDDTTGPLEKPYLRVERGMPPASLQEYSPVDPSSPLDRAYRSQASTSLGTRNAQSSQLHARDQRHASAYALGLEQFVDRPMSSRTLAPGQLVSASESNRCQQTTTSVSFGSIDPAQLYWSGLTPADYRNEWPLGEESGLDQWPLR